MLKNKEIMSYLDMTAFIANASLVAFLLIFATKGGVGLIQDFTPDVIKEPTREAKIRTIVYDEIPKALLKHHTTVTRVGDSTIVEIRGHRKTFYTGTPIPDTGIIIPDTGFKYPPQDWGVLNYNHLPEYKFESEYKKFPDR